MEFLMDAKMTFENIYSKEDPWNYKNTISDRTRRTILLKHIEVVFSDGSRKSVLDAGCGEGYLTRDVASQFDAEVDAFDISENALAIARRRNPHDNIKYFQLNFEDYTPTKQYDLILCEEALYYLSQEKRISAMKKFHDSIKAGGYLRITSIITGPTRDGNFFTFDALKEIVVSNGFQPVSIWPSVIKKNPFEKVFYRLLEYINKVKPVSSALISYFARQTLNRSLSNCRAVSILARKV